MAEKSTRIADASSGNYVATRDAIDPDGSSNARTIQIVDTASRQILTWTAMRGTSASVVSGEDSADLDAFSQTKLNVGDRSTLVVAAAHNQNDGSVSVTPVCYTSGEVEVPLETKTTAIGDVAFQSDLGDGNLYLSPVLSWDVLGAYDVSLHISSLSASNGVYLRGAVI